MTAAAVASPAPPPWRLGAPEGRLSSATRCSSHRRPSPIFSDAATAWPCQDSQPASTSKPPTRVCLETLRARRRSARRRIEAARGAVDSSWLALSGKVRHSHGCKRQGGVGGRGGGVVAERRRQREPQASRRQGLGQLAPCARARAGGRAGRRVAGAAGGREAYPGLRDVNQFGSAG